MSWMQKLCETYDRCADQVGVVQAGRVPLLPAYHTTQLAQIELVLDTEGNICPGRSSVIEGKGEQTTIIPCTESSAGRTSGLEPHPLFDKLQYLAGDFAACVPGKKSGYELYMEQLDRWCEDPACHPFVVAVWQYLKKGRLIADLAADGILWLDEQAHLLQKWGGAKEELPPIFRACTGGKQMDAFVRFTVLPADGSFSPDSRLWASAAVRQCYIDWQNRAPQERDICFVAGREMPVSVMSPKKIRNPGDGAKLVSSNDASGFTYRGRFRDAREAFSLGRETTEKAHSALRWLISRQGYKNGDQVVLTWRDSGGKLPSVCADSMDIAGEVPESPSRRADTGDWWAAQLNRALAGYSGVPDGGENAMILGLDSATPGRLSVFYYREMPAEDFLERIRRWHASCTWLHRYRSRPTGELDKKGKPKYEPATFVGAPSPIDIVETAYGRNVDDKLRKSALERLLPCIIEGAQLPSDLVHCAARRASNPIAMEGWEAGKTLSIACALIRKLKNDRINGWNTTGEYKEEWTMALDTQKTDRSYLFGRLLAYARQIESRALFLMEEKRATNAERLQQAFASHPRRTWKIIDGQLKPYLLRYKGQTFEYEKGIFQIIDMFEEGDFNDEPLDETYLLGYSSQMNHFIQTSKKSGKSEEKSPAESQSEDKQ